MGSEDRPASQNGDFVRSVARALEVIRCFSSERPSVTLSSVAEATGLTRATARRLLLTLEELGYVQSSGREFRLTARVLELGYAYLSSVDLATVVQPELEEISSHIKESSSASVLDGHDIMYILRVPARRIMTISLGIGTRLPAATTSMGRVLLADLDDERLEQYLEEVELPPRTPQSITSPDELREELKTVHEQGWALLDQELETGVRSIAVPLRDAGGRTIAAMNASSHAGRVTLEQMREEFLPMLLDAAGRVELALQHRS